MHAVTARPAARKRDARDSVACGVSSIADNGETRNKGVSSLVWPINTGMARGGPVDWKKNNGWLLSRRHACAAASLHDYQPFKPRARSRT